MTLPFRAPIISRRLLCRIGLKKEDIGWILPKHTNTFPLTWQIVKKWCTAVNLRQDDREGPPDLACGRA